MRERLLMPSMQAQHRPEWMYRRPAGTSTTIPRERHCGECHRRLVDSISVRRGYGPVCWQKVNRSPQLRLFVNHNPNTEGPTQ